MDYMDINISPVQYQSPHVQHWKATWKCIDNKEGEWEDNKIRMMYHFKRGKELLLIPIMGT